MTIVNVALPTIQRDLGGGLAAQQWIVDAYLLTLGSLILVGGSLGDIFGEVRMFTLGVALVRGRVRAVRSGADLDGADRVPRASRASRARCSHPPHSR